MKTLYFQRYYFIGIGGIGMSALARYMQAMGLSVAGYDRNPTELTTQLEREGIAVIYEERLENIPREFYVKEKTLIVYTPAIPKNHLQWNFFKDWGYTIKKRSELLGMITENTYSVAIAGTHGKTTTTSMLGHILHSAGKKSTSFLGGISENYQSNLILAGQEISVVEADEFDRSFLRLSPDKICITSMDVDHLDIYQKGENLAETYREFVRGLKVGGTLLIHKGLPIESAQTYAVEENADYYANALRREENCWFFDFHGLDLFWEKLPVPLAGRYNLENTTAALAIAAQLDITKQQAYQALRSFKGIKRRFSIHHHSTDKIYIDDYAHHPSELDALIKTVREWYPRKKILGVFQPHLFSRTRDFQEDFARSLEKLDALILLDIYPAREQAIEGVNAQTLLELINLKEKECSDLTRVLACVQQKDFEVLLSIGAGNIDTLVRPIKEWLDKTNPC
ncbi:UDP-N-acetylmuramate--L-alanine ligase [Bacteroidetes bacterium endosymbiont of Geopemphigus sp.]|uniref:UDP-N-acetylmuramate--L-alanine ligase n=1 Tax=Bacteroidetes bacterium endosymbiont of Geopemphigus sp. TaxID=2047937 RepID=UPI000CD314CD|nr:UDP-N-acetylmuramate--L-alanine ligase [Bacteroidetes bacterium endosymbiont of Geopemphigus sp.]